MLKLILSVAGLAIAGGVFFMFTQPHFDEVNAIKADIAQYDTALQKANELQQIKQKLLATYNAFRPEDIDRLHKLLPDHVDNVRLILDIDHLAQGHRMAVQNVVINAGDTSTPTAKEIVADAGSQKIDSLTLKFTTQGTYSQFMTFLEDLESSLRIVDMVALTITQSQVVSGEPVYKYDITIRTYWLK